MLITYDVDIVLLLKRINAHRRKIIYSYFAETRTENKFMLFSIYTSIRTGLGRTFVNRDISSMAARKDYNTAVTSQELWPTVTSRAGTMLCYRNSRHTSLLERFGFTYFCDDFLSFLPSYRADGDKSKEI
jgi:hypothetical protein